MRGSLVVACLAVRAPTPPHTVLTATQDRDTPSARGRCDLTIDGRHHDARVFVDGDRFHLAVLGPLGSPRLVLRSDGIGLALQQGTEQWVAVDANRILHEMALPTLTDAAALWWGRIPDRPVIGHLALPDGRTWVELDVGPVPITAILDPDHGVVLLDLGPPGMASVASMARRGNPLTESLNIDLGGLTQIQAQCAWTLGDVPPQAFKLGAGSTVTTTPLETLGRQVLAELAMLRARRQR